MATFTANVEWNEHDVYMSFTADMEWDDYGVPGSPRWLSPTNIKWGTYEVDGVEMDDAALLALFGEDAVKEINALLEGVLDDAEWEDDEPDYDDDRDERDERYDE